MDLTIDNTPIEQSEVWGTPRGPKECGPLIHTQRPNAQNPGGFRQNSGKLFGKPDLRETKLDTLTSINFAIGGVKPLRARIGNDNGFTPRNVALGDEMVTTSGVRYPKDAVSGTNRRNATEVLEDVPHNVGPHKLQHRRNFVCNALCRGRQVQPKV